MKFYTLDRKGMGRDLKRAREKFGLPLKQIAWDAGMTPSHIWSLERGEKDVSLERFFSLCLALGLPAELVLADNIVVSADAFSKAAEVEARKIHADVEKEIWPGLREYIGGCCVIVAYALLSPGVEFSFGRTTFPTQGMADAFGIVQDRISHGFTPKRRREMLLKIQNEPAQTLVDLQIFTKPLVDEFLKFKRKKENTNTPWIPIPKRGLDLIFDAFPVMDDADPRLLGQRIRTLVEDLPLLVAGELKTRSVKEKSSEKRGIDILSENRNITAMKSELQGLLKKVAKLTEPRGMKSALAVALDVPAARVSEWLAGKYEPSGEAALKLLRWIEQQEGK